MLCLPNGKADAAHPHIVDLAGSPDRSDDSRVADIGNREVGQGFVDVSGPPYGGVRTDRRRRVGRVSILENNDVES